MRNKVCSNLFSTEGTISMWFTVYAVIPSKTILVIPMISNSSKND
ncbi:MAG: hypothetical protein SO160_08735 [Lachnospiraceae bacterium]|nr:hypothetical protein [Lachnospiraceae bacterium]